jgi:hypothetical protein
VSATAVSAGGGALIQRRWKRRDSSVTIEDVRRARDTAVAGLSYSLSLTVKVRLAELISVVEKRRIGVTSWFEH